MAQRWREEFLLRLRALLREASEGRDPVPAARFKAEGFAAAGLQLGLVDAVELMRMLDDAYIELYGEPVAALFPFSAAECIDAEACCVRLPFLMKRAPVYPSTATDGGSGQ